MERKIGLLPGEASRNQQTEGLLELILTRENLNRAYQQVKRNKGAGGIDGMQVDELLPYLRENREKLLQSLRDILLVGCKLWKRRIPNGMYGAVGGRLLK